MRKSFTHNGQRYWVSGKTKKELEANYKKKLKEVSRTGKDWTFKEWCEEYISTYKVDVDSNTLENFKMRVKNFLLPDLGDRTLNNITHMQCQKIMSSLKGYSTNYIGKVYYDMNQLFEGAVFNGLIEVNPAKGCVKPKGHTNTRRSLTEEELTVVLRLCKSHPCGLWVMLMLYCGLRPHETAIVQGKDIQGNTLHIRGYKSKNGDRYVPIPSGLLELLPDVYTEEYLIKSPKGHFPIQKHHRVKMWGMFKRDLEEIIGETDITPYCLRHTYCTNLQNAGVPITTARDLMGHSTIKLTADIYTHQTLASFNASAEMINAHFLQF